MFRATQADLIQSIFVALILLIIGLVLIQLYKSPNKKYLSGLFFSAFLLRTILLYAVYYYLVNVGGDGFVFADDRNYDIAGTQIAALLKVGKDGYMLHSWQQNPGYFYFNGWLYSILGTDTFSARVTNAFLSSMTAILVFEIARMLFNLRVAKIAGLLSAFMPNIMFLSVLQFKDTALIFVMVFTVYLLVSKKDQKITFFSVISLSFALYIMWFLRKDFTLPYIGIVFLWLILRYTGLEKWIERMQKSGLSAFAGIALLVIIGAVLIGFANTNAGHVFVERFDRITGDNQEFTENASTAQIGFSRHLRINSLADAYKLPVAVAFTTILPLPSFGLLTSSKQAGLVLYSISNIAFILLLPFVIVGFSLIKDTGFANTVMLKWVPLILLIGISIVFMGVLRYKEQLMPFFIIWAALALSERNKFKTRIGLMYFAGSLGVLVAVIVASVFR